MAKCKNCNNLYNMTDITGKNIVNWCPKINDCPDIEIERECEYCNATTNADRIRNMTDEELAEFIQLKIDHGMNCLSCQEPKDEEGDCIGECVNETLRWLQKEAE